MQDVVLLTGIQHFFFGYFLFAGISEVEKRPDEGERQ